MAYKLIDYIRMKRHNLKSWHHRWMMRYLQKRGWVVFYLEPEFRGGCKGDVCWMKLYQEDQDRNNRVINK